MEDKEEKDEKEEGDAEEEDTGEDKEEKDEKKVGDEEEEGGINAEKISPNAEENEEEEEEKDDKEEEGREEVAAPLRRSTRVVVPAIRSPWIETKRKARAKRPVEERDALYQMCISKCTAKEGEEYVFNIFY